MRVGVVTTTAGGATMVVDPLATRGIEIEAASAATLAQLAAAGIEVKPARIVDLTIAGARYESMKSTLDILLAAPEFDLVLAVVGSSARSYPQATVRPIIDSAGTGKPLAVFLVPEAPEALAALSRAGVPNFRTPGGLRRRHRRRARAPTAAALTAAIRVALSGKKAGPGHDQASATMLDEHASGVLLDRLGIARAPSVALDSDIARPPALPFPYPVVVKVLCG